MTAPIPAKGFDNAERNLAALSVRLGPMHTEAWCHKKPDLDRPTPSRPLGAHPDYVPGILRDCGLGDERVRQRWAEMICHLRIADETATTVLCSVAGVTRHPPAAVYRPTSLTDAQFGVRRLQERYKALRAFWEQWPADDPSGARRLVDALMKGPSGGEQNSCCDHIEQAMYRAQRVIPIVGTGKPPATCTQCRRLGSIGQPRIGGVCYACDKRNQRAGVPRRTTVAVKQRRATLRAAKRAVS